MAKVLIVTSGLGKELCDLLREKLGLPQRVTKFSVHFELNEVVKVDCAYLPTEPDEKDRYA